MTPDVEDDLHFQEEPGLHKIKSQTEDIVVFVLTGTVVENKGKSRSWLVT
jgi:hypothetical protein